VIGDVLAVSSVPDAFAELVLAAIGDPRPDRFSLFLSGGSTAEACYRRLAERSAAGTGGSWTEVDVYLGDERCVPLDHPDSNHRMVAETLLDAVGPVGSDHPMYREGEPDQAAADYQASIAPLPAYDVIHLGVGPDGHTASLFPGSAALGIADPDRLVVATSDPTGTNPHRRITLTLPAIARARMVVFTVSGASKRDAFGAIRSGRDLPAARVRAGKVVWLVDGEAGGDLVATR
jgi:6-phosphogluconolactonase